MSNSQPIGIFDSGIGGTSIWREVTALIPNEKTIYFADSANAPYGDKSPQEIIQFCIKNTEYLLQQGCKLIIVACNTATTNAIDLLRNTYDVPFIGIEPAIKPAALKTSTKSIGILATKGTLSSELFSKTSDQFTTDIKVIEKEGKGIVKLIENGKMYSNEMTQLLHQYLDPMLIENIDHLVLGCTHYPYLISQIQQIVGANVNIIDSGLAVAKQTYSILEKHNLKNEFINNHISHEFSTNGDPMVLKKVLTDVSLKYTITETTF